MNTLIEPTGMTRGVLALDYVARSDCAGLIAFSNNATSLDNVSAHSSVPLARSTGIDATMRLAVDRYDGLLRRLAD